MQLRSLRLALALSMPLGLVVPAQAGGPAVTFLRTQKVNDVTYFIVRFERPADMAQVTAPVDWWWWGRQQWARFTRLPRLLPQDGNTRLVYLELEGVRDGNIQPVERITFLGKIDKLDQAQFLLIYPTNAPEKKEEESALARVLRQRGSWKEVPVKLNLNNADRLKVPDAGFRRTPNTKDTRLEENDLEGRWARAQAAQFAVLEALTQDFGFYAFARETTARKYSVSAPSPINPWGGPPDQQFLTQRLYSLTTGAEAIAESLALNRMRNRDNFRDKGPRTIPISKVQGIDIAEHPWEKMMAGKKPEAEPLARLTPHDNYYLHFKTFARFIEMNDLLDQWGTTLIRAVEVNSRDFRLKQKLEQQLCIKADLVVRAFGPAAVKSLALTGSDLHFRQGSDVTLLFHVINKGLVLAQLNEFLRETRKQWGDQLKESRSERHGITIESYTTKRREISMHRAVFDDYIIYGNSLTAVQRVLDTYKGKYKALADSLDFQYMRVCFPLSDEREDGFLFLSDPFLRHVVGPALRIKERRRLEAITSMYMATHGALYCAWETGRLPRHQDELLALTGMNAEELFSPDGGGVFWDPQDRVAFSPLYNTLHFTTPLIELPIDNITEQEQREYQQFRAQYLGLWRQFFDPIGVRMSLKEGQVRVETYILPLVQNSQYNELRRLTGGGTIKLDPRQFGPSTLVQFLAHFNPEARERTDVMRGLQAIAGQMPRINWLGNWFTLRFDDSDVYGKLLELGIRRQLDPNGGQRWEEEARLLFQMPVVFGVEISNPLVFAGVLATFRKQVMDALPNAVTWEPLKEEYKGVKVVEIKAQPGGLIAKEVGAQPALYYGLIDGAWYISFRQEPLRELIDRWEARKKNTGKPGETIAVNTALYVAPEAARKTRPLIQQYLEWETHLRVMNSNNVLYPLFRTGLVTAKAAPHAIARTALQFYGYVPVSPDDSLFSYEKKTDDVVNARHGSQRQPRLHPGIENNSPLGLLLESLRTLRVDLWFREDGINTVLTVQRKGKE